MGEKSFIACFPCTHSWQGRAMVVISRAEDTPPHMYIYYINGAMCTYLLYKV
jgi:hypothetical protein